MSASIRIDTEQASSLPWWRYWQVWMVVLLPAIVVVASVSTYFIAANGVDPVLARDSQPTTTQVGSSEKIVISNPSLAPAVMGRNHAATGVKPSVITP